MIFAEYDIYCGIRDKHELYALKEIGAYDVSLWIDRGYHLPRESPKSCTVGPWMVKYRIDNNKDLDDLTDRLREFMENMQRG